MTMADARITVEELVYDDQLRCGHNGAPVTGPVWEFGPDGQVISEITYCAGVQDGPTRLFRPTGELEFEEWYRAGVLQRRRVLHPNGQVRQEVVLERLAVVTDRRWTEAGVEIDAVTGRPLPPTPR